MISILPSPNADTRTSYDFAHTTREQLLQSSLQHIGDVAKGLAFFGGQLTHRAGVHDYDKLTEIERFLEDFRTGFKQTGWWDAHRKMHRHHLAQGDGVPDDVNLIDVLEYIVDCVMAGKARSGEVYPLAMTADLLLKAFINSVEMLKANVQVLRPEVVDGRPETWLDRLKVEHKELDEKTNKLAIFLGSTAFAELPNQEMKNLLSQFKHMEAYCDVLKVRLKSAGVELPEAQKEVDPPAQVAQPLPNEQKEGDQG